MSRDKEGLSELGRVGQRNLRAQSYWDRLMAIDEAARLLHVTISTLKEAALSGGTIHGKPAPEVAQWARGRAYFEGRAIKALVEDR